MSGVTPLRVDGVRPALEWVSLLPAQWVTAPQRLILVVLACDAFVDESTPGGETLAHWTGLSRTHMYANLGKLELPTDLRPPLIERLDHRGEVLEPGVRHFRKTPVSYRLLTYVDASSYRPKRAGVVRDDVGRFITLQSTGSGQMDDRDQSTESGQLQQSTESGQKVTQQSTHLSTHLSTESGHALSLTPSGNDHHLGTDRARHDDDDQELRLKSAIDTIARGPAVARAALAEAQAARRSAS